MSGSRKPALCLAVCATVADEVQAVLAQQGWSDVAVEALPLACLGPAADREGALAKQLRDWRRRYAAVERLCDCLAMDPRGNRQAGGGCFELLVNPPLVRHWIDTGAFLTTPGWLRRWKSTMSLWGLDAPAARTFFGESASRILLLDTGVWPEAAGELAGFGEFVGLPVETVPVGLDHAAAVIRGRVLAWRERAGRRRLARGEAEQRLADYAMALDLAGDLAARLSEADVTEGILELMATLCAPRELLYVPFVRGEPGEPSGRPDPDPARVRALLAAWGQAGRAGGGRAHEDGFLLPFYWQGECLGVLQMAGPAFPEHGDHYLALALELQRVLSLALANARAFEERIMIESSMRENQHFTAIGTMVGGIGHEISNPLSGIMGYAQLIVDRAPPGPAAEFAREILHECGRVAAVVQEMRRFAAQDDMTGESTVSVPEAVRGVLLLVHKLVEKSGIKLDLGLPEAPLEAAMAAGPLQHVLVNVIMNARESLDARYDGSHPDKCMRLAVEQAEGDAGPCVRVCVEDHGQGIRAEHLGRIFEPFFTTRSRSRHAGLGLSVSRRIVEEHGGSIRVDSDPGGWTRVRIDLAPATAGV